MAQGNNTGTELQRANFRRCILHTWPNFTGLGFNLENCPRPPHLIRTVESNSPAAAAKLKILDAVLSVNGQDVSNAEYSTVTQAIKNARDTQNRIDLLVIEKRFYDPLKAKGIEFNAQYAITHETPPTMPKEYTMFPKYTPRSCEIKLLKGEETFGFEIVNGAHDIGVYIQEVHPNTPASRTSLRKCDRVLEINDKYVNTESSKAISDKLGAAKKKRFVKLYVVDTFTYKYFQDNGIPLTSKEYKKSSLPEQLRRQQQPQSRDQDYINIADVRNDEPRSPDMTASGPFFPQTTTTTNQDNIRLYTIARANPTESYGIELNYHRREKFHSLKFLPIREAVLGQIEVDNHLIEVNGKNIEKMDDTTVHQHIRGTKFPQPLQLLVADSATYNHYKQQHKQIHSGLPTVRRIPEDRTSSNRQTRASTTTTATGISSLVNQNPIEPVVSDDVLRANARRYELYHIQNFTGYGFSVNSSGVGTVSHKINKIAPNSPAERQGLRPGDHIISVNGQNVQKMSGQQFNTLLRSAVSTPSEQDIPLVLEVINEEFYGPSNTRASTLTVDRRDTRHDSSVVTEIVKENPIPAQGTPKVSRTNTQTPTTIRHDTGTSQANPSTHDSPIYAQRQSTSDSKPPQRSASRTSTAPKLEILASQQNPSTLDSPIHAQQQSTSDSRPPQRSTSGISTAPKVEILASQQNPSTLDSPIHVQQQSTSDSRPPQRSTSGISTAPKLEILASQQNPSTQDSSIYDNDENISDSKPPKRSTSRTSTAAKLEITKPQRHPSTHTASDYVPFVNTFDSKPPQPSANRTQTDTRQSTATPQRTPSNYDRQTPVRDDRTYSNALRSNVSPYESQRSLGPSRSTTGLYAAVNQQHSPIDQRSHQLSPLSLFYSRENLSRGAIDMVSGQRLLRYCRLTTEMNQPFGFEIISNENQHFIRNILKNSPAERAGLNENDRLVEIDCENIENRSRQDIQRLIQTAKQNGVLRLFVSPHDIKVLAERSSKSMTSLNDSRQYRDPIQPRYHDGSLSSRDRSIPRYYNSETNRSRPYLYNAPNAYSAEPNAPLPRKCLLQKDPSFRGCGFRLTERDNYDTPIVLEVDQNSPAKRSGLTEGDHIIYIDSQNVQNLNTFNHITHLIQRKFEQNDQVTLTTLTGPAYHVLKRRGGYLDSIVFDYQTPSVEELKPRLYRLQLSAYDFDFGFTVQNHDFCFIRTIDEQSTGYLCGLRKNDIILEINGRMAKQLSIYQIEDILEMSKRDGKLDLLVIDFDGYQYSTRHAIPLNSLLPFVQVMEEQRITRHHRPQYEPVYL